MSNAAQPLTDPADPAGDPWALRHEQAEVFQAFRAYRSQARGDGPRFCAIVLPPRTGKTVIAGHIIRAEGAAATVIVPTRTLVHQTRALLRSMLPDTPVGVFSGEEDSVVERGVNVTTYAMLLHWGAARLPEALKRSRLVFVDEAHRAMTPARMAVLRDGFSGDAVRVALTATPDYDADRRLRRFFPDLIKEISLAEALQLKLLAPSRAWVATVDCDASQVRITGDDFDAAHLSRLMSHAPFFEAAARFRYAEQSCRKAALVCCGTRQQAWDLCRYLERVRPAGTASPELLLGETPAAERSELLRRFEAGAADTIVQVGVLIEGWSSPRCKLVVDLAPTLSRVRATQKYFRAMTRDGDAEAHLFVVLPTELPAQPTLPVDLFFEPDHHYRCGDLLDPRAPQPVKPVWRYPATVIAGVRLAQTVTATGPLGRPTLDRADRRGLLAVLESCAELDLNAPPNLFRFRALWFRHAKFTGRGQHLLQWLGYPPTVAGYSSFLVRAAPQAAADALLREAGMGELCTVEQSCADDVGRLERALKSSQKGRKAWPELERTLGLMRPPSPEASCIAAGDARWLGVALNRLTPRKLSVLERRFGLGGEEPQLLAELEVTEQVSYGRAGQIVHTAVRQLAWTWKKLQIAEDFLHEAPRPGAVPELISSRRVGGCTAHRLREHLLEHLQASGVPLSGSDLCARLRMTRFDVADALLGLVAQGQVSRTAQGYVPARAHAAPA